MGRKSHTWAPLRKFMRIILLSKDILPIVMGLWYSLVAGTNFRIVYKWIIYWKYLLLRIKYIFLRDSYVCTRWIFIFDSDQAQIYSVVYLSHAESAPSSSCDTLNANCGRLEKSLLETFFIWNVDFSKNWIYSIS